MSNRPTILSFVKDIPNIITLLGLSCGILGIYFAVLENFPAALLDWPGELNGLGYCGWSSRYCARHEDTEKEFKNFQKIVMTAGILDII